MTVSDLPGAEAALEATAAETTGAGSIARIATGDVSAPGDVEALVAGHVAKFGITANIYSLGVIKTPMWDSIDEVVTTQEGKPRGSQWDKMLPNIALRRTGRPEDVARVVSFLASEDSAYVTGQSIVVDGGIYFV